MKTETKMIWSLLLLPIFFGEILSGNFPPLRLAATYFTPLIAFFLLYGCGTLLMHELRARWNLQWSLLFLAVAYALLEEGIATKAFWNPGHGGPESVFSTYGYLYGVKWVWMFHVGAYHATLSTLVPLFIVTLLWPEMAHTPLLGKTGFRWVLGGFSFVCLFGFLCFGEIPSETNPGENEVFYPLQLDPLRLLKLHSRNKTLVASWNGKFQDGVLSYAEPDHPEYKPYRDVDVVVVPVANKTTASH